MQVGGPLVLFVTLFLLGGATLLQQRSHDAPAASASSPISYSAAAPAPASPASSYSYAPAYGSGVPISAAPSSVTLVAALNYPARPSQEEMEYMELERLRQTTAYVDAVVEATQAERAARARAAYSGATMSLPAGSGPATGFKSMMPASVSPDNYL